MIENHGSIYEKEKCNLAEAEDLQKKAVEAITHAVGEGNPDIIFIEETMILANSG